MCIICHDDESDYGVIKVCPCKSNDHYYCLDCIDNLDNFKDCIMCKKHSNIVLYKKID